MLRRLITGLGRVSDATRGEWRVSSSSPGPHPEFADPARLVPLRERSRRARRPPRVGAVRLASDGAALYLSSPVVGEHCVYRWDLPPESEEEGAPLRGEGARKTRVGFRDSPRASHGRGALPAELPAAISRNVGLVSGATTRRGGVASSVRSDRVPDRGHGVRESHANARGDARVGHLPRRLSTVHRGRG